MNYTLSLCLLVSTSITVAMELVQSSVKKEIYALFVDNQQAKAETKIKSNDDEKMTISLLKYGIKQNNANFIQWFLVIKQLPSDHLALQQSLEYSRGYNNEAAHVLNKHIQLRQDLDVYAKKEVEKIARAKRSLENVKNQNKKITEQHRDMLTTSDEWQAQTSNKAQWDTWMKDAKPIPETLTIIEKDGTTRVVYDTQDDCKCIIL
jgi:hypothetical protein